MVAWLYLGMVCRHCVMLVFVDTLAHAMYVLIFCFHAPCLSTELMTEFSLLRAKNRLTLASAFSSIESHNDLHVVLDFDGVGDEKEQEKMFDSDGAWGWRHVPCRVTCRFMSALGIMSCSHVASCVSCHVLFCLVVPCMSCMSCHVFM